MQAFQLVYNERTKQFVSKKYNIKKPQDMKYIAKSNVSSPDKNILTIDEDAFYYNMACLNNNLGLGNLEVKKCICCDKFFVLNDKEKDWYCFNNMAYPKKCKLCRGKK